MKASCTKYYPDAVRGDSVKGAVRETAEQLSADLVWWGCAFCERSVLVYCSIKGREKCACGAVRCHSKGQEGWRRGDHERWFI